MDLSLNQIAITTIIHSFEGPLDMNAVIACRDAAKISAVNNAPPHRKADLMESIPVITFFHVLEE